MNARGFFVFKIAFPGKRSVYPFRPHMICARRSEMMLTVSLNLILSEPFPLTIPGGKGDLAARFWGTLPQKTAPGKVLRP